MARNLRFFYFGNQCPNNGYLLARVKTVAWRESVPLHLYDVTDDEEICREFEVFSPQLLLVNDAHRVHGPFSKELVTSILDDSLPEAQVEEPAPGGEVVRGELAPIRGDSVFRACGPCTGTDDSGLCYGKSEWIGEMLRRSGLDHLGYLHFTDDRCVGGAEFLPSSLVPYPMPEKGRRDAFLTCLFRSDPVFDFRTHPLEGLLDDLKRFGFEAISVAAAKGSSFPNGPAEWFAEKGFEDRGILAGERAYGSELRLMRMAL